MKSLLSLVLFSTLYFNVLSQSLSIESGNYLFKRSGTNDYLTMIKDGSGGLWLPKLVSERAPNGGWRVDVLSNNEFTLRTNYEFLGIEVAGKAHQLKGFKPKSSDNPLWRMIKSPNGKVCFQHLDSELYLIASSNKVIYGTTNLNEAMEFEIFEKGQKVKSPSMTPNKTVYLHPHGQSKKIVSSPGIGSGDIVELHSGSNMEYAFWKLIKTGNGYQIQNTKNLLFLTNAGHDSKNARIRLTSQPDNFAVWTFDFADGVPSIKHRASGLFLSAENEILILSKKETGVTMRTKDKDLTNKIVK